MSEVDELVARGMTREEFELTRDFLVSYSKLWARNLGDRLGILMDSRLYGMPYFIDEIERQLSGLTLEQVNAAIRKYFRTDNVSVVMVADGAEALRKDLLASQPSPIVYATRVAEDVTRRDATMAALPITPASVRIVPIEQTFAARGTPPPATLSSGAD
jgi:zinc protease